MHSQISEQLYLNLIDKHTFTMCDQEQKEHALKQWFYCEELDCMILVIDNYLSETQSYYIRDINA